MNQISTFLKWLWFHFKCAIDRLSVDQFDGLYQE